MTRAAGPWSCAPEMSNVLSEEKRKQIEALGQLGWSLRRIEEATGVRRETASCYLKAAGIAVRAPRGRRAPKPAKEEEALTDFSAGKQRIAVEPAEACDAKPASCVAEAPADSGGANSANEPITDPSGGVPPATSPEPVVASRTAK